MRLGIGLDLKQQLDEVAALTDKAFPAASHTGGAAP